jgi:hypothetical protein
MKQASAAFFEKQEAKKLLRLWAVGFENAHALTPSFRAQRSNPSFFPRALTKMDCIAALAMTRGSGTP